MDDSNRLCNLGSYHILDTPAETHFDQLTWLAAFVSSTPVAMIVLVDENRQWLKSAYGVDSGEIEISRAFCVSTLESPEAFIVRDTLSDARFSQDPLVTGAPGVRFFLGIPLISREGFALGLLAVMDKVPRTPDAEQIAALAMLANQVTAHLNAHRARFDAKVSLGSDETIARQKNRELVENLRLVLERITDGFFSLDQHWCFSYVNAEAERMLGKSRDQLLGRNIWEEIPEAVNTLFEANYREARRVQKKISFEEYFAPLKTWFRVNVYPAADGLSVYFQDVNEERRKEDQLRLLETCVARMNDLVIITEAEPIDETGPAILFVNDAFVARTGYSRAEVIGRSPYFLQGPNTSREEMRRIKQAIRARQPVRAELINYTRAGEELWLEMDLFPIADNNGCVTHWVSVERDISERKGIEQKLYESEQRSKLIARATADAIWDWDLVSDLLWWGDGMQTLFGYSQEELEKDSQSWTNRIHPEDSCRVVDSIMAAIEGGINNWNEEYRFRRSDGSYAYVQDRGFIIRAGDGKAIRMVGGMTDVTAARQAEMELKNMGAIKHAQQLAELASQAKSNFLATMSHEIRTPISGVIGMVDVLHQTSLKGYQIEMVDIIRDSANSLLEIIDDILDFSKIESGKMELESVAFPLERNIEKVCALLDRTALDKQVELSLFTAPELPAEVIGDELRLRQILLNLLHNAIKFSAKSVSSGRVRLNTRVISRRAADVVIEFEITDNGVGMSEETLNNLFTPFMQADASTTRHFGGTGLGLTITHHLVDLMCGEIHVESRLDLGSVFRVQIPFTLPTYKYPVPDSRTDWRTLVCILLGEPKGMGDVWRSYLEATGARVIPIMEITQIHSLVLPADSTAYDWLLLLDQINPAQDPGASYQAAERALAPIVQKPLYGLVIGRGRRRELRRDISGLVYIDGNALGRLRFLHALDVALGRVEIGKSLERGYHEEDFQPPAREDAIHHGRLLLLAEDNETNQKVIKQQLALLGFAVDVVSNGAQAFEKLMQQEYAVLITDIHMPVMDGYELIAKVRAAREPFQQIPIIALSANALTEETDKCKVLGANEYLVKPALLPELKTMLEHYVAGGEKSLGSLPANTATSVNEHFNCQVLRELVGGDDGVVIDFLTDYLQSAQEMRQQMTDAFGFKKMHELAAVAHKLKSSSRSVGAILLGQLCEDIEHAVNQRQADLPGLMNRFLTEFTQVAELVNRKISNHHLAMGSPQ